MAPSAGTTRAKAIIHTMSAKKQEKSWGLLRCFIGPFTRIKAGGPERRREAVRPAHSFPQGGPERHFGGVGSTKARQGVVGVGSEDFGASAGRERPLYEYVCGYWTTSSLFVKGKHPLTATCCIHFCLTCSEPAGRFSFYQPLGVLFLPENRVFRLISRFFSLIHPR
jgi:hypothetical protein